MNCAKNCCAVHLSVTRATLHGNIVWDSGLAGCFHAECSLPGCLLPGRGQGPGGLAPQDGICTRERPSLAADWYSVYGRGAILLLSLFLTKPCPSLGYIVSCIAAGLLRLTAVIACTVNIANAITASVSKSCVLFQQVQQMITTAAAILPQATGQAQLTEAVPQQPSSEKPSAAPTKWNAPVLTKKVRLAICKVLLVTLMDARSVAPTCVAAFAHAVSAVADAIAIADASVLKTLLLHCERV